MVPRSRGHGREAVAVKLATGLALLLGLILGAAGVAGLRDLDATARQVSRAIKSDMRRAVEIRRDMERPQ